MYHPISQLFSFLVLVLSSWIVLHQANCAKWKSFQRHVVDRRRLDSYRFPGFQRSGSLGEDGSSQRISSKAHRDTKAYLFGRHVTNGTRHSSRLHAAGKEVPRVESRTKVSVVRQYGAVFRPSYVDPYDEPLIDLDESDPDNFIQDFVSYMDDPRSKSNIIWHHPYIRTFSQRAALYSLPDFMPKSRIRECLNVTDGSNVDDIVDRSCHGYYCNRHINAFFKYEEEFNYMRNGTDITPRRLEPPKLQMPMNMPQTEGDKNRASVPLGWRTFAVLGLYPTATEISDPSVLWHGYRLEDGDPMGRLASGLYSGNLASIPAIGKNATKPGNTLLRSKHPIEPEEQFRGRKGDLSHLGPQEPRQHQTINESKVEHMFSDDGLWPKRQFECVVSSMTVLQALWARLSTTMLRSTAKMHRLYKLRLRKNFKQEVFSAVRKFTSVDELEKVQEEPVETSVGVIYFISAPTLHHATNFVCSDPLARGNFYRQLLMFEADDALKDGFLQARHPDKENPRQYLVLGSYDGSETPELLKDKMTRFLVRSNCVNTHVMLHPPRKDSMVDFSMPLQQFLPITSEQGARVLANVPSLKAACSNPNAAPAIGDLSIINQFDFDDALDWARRSPYTRAGCYESLFVAKAHEIGFYGRSCSYIAPLPMAKSMTPVRQEYAIIERDPVDVLKKRMLDGISHAVALPKVIPRSSEFYRELDSLEQTNPGDVKDTISANETEEVNNHKEKQDADQQNLKNMWPNRLLITIRRTVAGNFQGDRVSSRFCALKKRRVEKQVHLGKVPFLSDQTLAVDTVQDMGPSGRRKGIKMRLAAAHQTTNTKCNITRDDPLHVEDASVDVGTPSEVQILPNVLLSSRVVQRLLSESAPTELDQPFYADLLKNYVYISLPPGDFFECLPGYHNRRFNEMSPGHELNTPVSADDMNKLPENKPQALAGFWIKKSECYLLYKNAEERYMVMGKGPQRNGSQAELNEQMVKRVLLKNEICMDYARKGSLLNWPDTSNAYSRRDGKLITHLSPEEQLKTIWTVKPLRDRHARFYEYDELPAARFYEKNVEYSPDDPRHLMAQHPEEVYKMTLEFMRKVDRGEARVEDDPVKALVEADYILPTKHNDTVTTWEEAEAEASKLNETEPIEDKA